METQSVFKFLNELLNNYCELLKTSKYKKEIVERLETLILFEIGRISRLYEENKN